MRLLLAAVLACPASAMAAWHSFILPEYAVIPDTKPVPVAIILTAKVNGKDCHAQLDTGAPKAVYWHAATSGSEAPGPVTIELAGITQTSEADASQLQGCATGIPLTVGNAFFETGTLTLDLKNARYDWVAGSQLSPEADTMQYVRWGGPGGHPLMQVRAGGAEPLPALLDTGSAAFGIAAHDEQSWSELTAGLPKDSPGLRHFSGNAWGKQIDCGLGEIKRPLEIGGAIKLTEFLVGYCDDKRFKPGSKLAGVLGLHHFLGKVIVLDYPAQRWAVRAPEPK
jgi:hypothetical protein